MKKLLALLLTLVISATLFAGCSDPVYDDLSNFLNVQMTEVNAEYVSLTEEVGNWATFEDDTAIAESLNTVLIPLVDSSLAKLENIVPETEEVKALKDKYVGVMEAYKEGFTALLEGCETQEEATINEGYAALDEAVTLLDEYNKGLEALAKEFGAEIEY